MQLKGKAWVFDGVMDVDWEICPTATAHDIMIKAAAGQIRKEDMVKEMGKYCMTKVDPDFPKKVQPGDFIVAGKGMGYGHDHDHACLSIKGAGVGAVICEPTNTNFKRNCIHHGLPMVEVKGIRAATNAGDELEVNFAEGVVRNLTSGNKLHFQPYPDFLIEILQADGVYPLLKSKIEAGETWA